MQSERPAVAGIDIDGVIADPAHRLHFIERRPRDWRNFFAHAYADPPLVAGIAVVNDLIRRGITPAFVSGRPDYLRRTTVKWLREQDLPADVLYLRARGDFRPAPDLKLEIYTRLAQEFEITQIIDDDERVVARLRDCGFEVSHADWFKPDERDAKALTEAQDESGRS